MKKIFAILLILAPLIGWGQVVDRTTDRNYMGSATFGTESTTYTATDPSAWLEIGKDSTTKGMIIPRVVDTSDIENQAKGMVIFQNSDSTIYYSDGERWSPIGGSVDLSPFARKDSVYFRHYLDSALASKLVPDDTLFLHQRATDSTLIVPRKDNDYMPDRPELISRVPVDTGGFDVILEMGQSNITGRDGDVGNPDYPFNSKVGNATWDADANDTVTLNTLRGGAVRGSFDNYFADKYYTLTGHNVITVDGSKVGAGISSLSGYTSVSEGNNWSPSGNLRGRMLEYWNSLKSKTGITKVKAIIWAQGERDARQMDADPSYTLDKYVDSLRDWITWCGINWPGVPIFISELGNDNTGSNTEGWQGVRETQVQFADEYSNVYIGFDSAQYFWEEGKMYDDVHYSYKGYKQMGEALATSIHNYQQNRSDEYTLSYYNPKYGWQNIISGIEKYVITTNEDNATETTFAGDVNSIRNTSFQWVKKGSLGLPSWEPNGGALLTYYTNAGGDAGFQLFMPLDSAIRDFKYIDIRKSTKGTWYDWFKINTAHMDSLVFLKKSDTINTGYTTPYQLDEKLSDFLPLKRGINNGFDEQSTTNFNDNYGNSMYAFSGSSPNMPSWLHSGGIALTGKLFTSKGYGIQWLQGWGEDEFGFRSLKGDVFGNFYHLASREFVRDSAVLTNGNSSIDGTLTAKKYFVSNLNVAPTSATATGTKGEIRVTADYIYVCIDTDTWVRCALETW